MLKRTKLTAISLIAIAPCLVYANTLSSSTQTVTPFNSYVSSSESVPLKKSSLQVIPLKSMPISEDEKISISKRAAEQKRKGFFETYSQYAKFLLELPSHASAEIKEFKTINDTEDTHLKSNLNDIKLAFHSKEINVISKPDIIGYAPIGSWQNGWTGFKVFFRQANQTICSYSYYNLELSNGSAQVNDEYATRDINNKVSFIDIEGNAEGFLYSVNWFEDKVVHYLECANPKYDKSITESTISLARKIDKNIS